MSFRVSGKNIEIGEALRERIGARVLEAIEKYFEGGGFSGHATIGKEAFGYHTECVVHLDSGVVLSADSMAADAYLSADQAADKLEKQLRRYHRRLKDYHGNGRGDPLPADDVRADDVPLTGAPDRPPR
jgi:ribosomal subunit interface protein